MDEPDHGNGAEQADNSTTGRGDAPRAGSAGPGRRAQRQPPRGLVAHVAEDTNYLVPVT